MSIQIKSFNQILGTMVRKIVAETPLSDVNPGSVLLSLLEACASNDFENNAAILNVLELLSVDSIRNNDLDNKAADFGLTRKAAIAASGMVSIYNTNIQKQSASLYSLKPAPIAGQTVLFVTNTTGWAASGTLYIGRGTTSFEGPIPYTSITSFATYSQINLGSALQKDHLSSDSVINAQGQPDRLISAGTLVKIAANNQSAEVRYTILRDAVIAAGEDHVDNVLVLAQTAGSQGNALINTIKQFDSAPFAGASVTNTQAFTSGADVETDVQLRNRIKSYSASLARGTSPAILNAVIGLSDPDENKRVTSAHLTHPVTVGAPSILYVDDGSGFQPSYAGQAVDVLLARANGTEEFLQLANYPLPRPQVVNNAIGPFSLTDQMFFRVAVDGEEDTIVFTASDFSNISAATVAEIVAALNSKSSLFKARLTNDSQNILIYAADPDAEILQVVPLRSSDDDSLYVNDILLFPTKECSYIALYQNSTRLRQRSETATVNTVGFAAWNLLVPGNLIISVDGTPAQDAAFTLADFAGVDSFTLLTLEDWVTAINAKFAGVTAVATPGQTMQISSNKEGDSASIEILGGSYQAAMFSTNSTEAVGQESQFEINRQTGTIRLLTEVVEGDTISAGVSDAKGFVVSTATASGTFNLDDDAAGREATMVIVADATKCDRVTLNLQVGDTLEVVNQGDGVVAIESTATAFLNMQPGHFLYIAQRTSGWFTANNTGIFRVVSRDVDDGVSSTIYIRNLAPTNEIVTLSDVTDIVAFDTDAYPQIWRSSLLSTPAATTLSALNDSINNNISGVRSSTFRTSSIKLTSTTETGGSIAIPVSIGSVALVFPASTSLQLNNDPLIGSKVPQKDVIGFPKPGAIVSGNSYLGRAVYPFVGGALTTATTQDPPAYAGTYAETITAANILTSANVGLSDIVLFSRGNNKGLMRSIAAKPDANSIGTQHGLPRTLFNHVIGDAVSGLDQPSEVTLLQSLKLGADDSLVCVMDNDATVKTIDINAARNARINSGSASASFVPTTTEFSASDIDNESGIDFSTANVWGTTINGTDFSDYAILMRSRNWYASGGTASGAGKFLVRSSEYGSNGDKMCFSMKYPSDPNQSARTTLLETPSYNLLSYLFGSGAARATALTNGTVVTVTGPYSDTSINFPAGASTGATTVAYSDSFTNLTNSRVQLNASPYSANVRIGDNVSFAGYAGETRTVKSIESNFVIVLSSDWTLSSGGTLTISRPAQYWDLSFGAGSLTAVQVNDVLSVITGSGLSSWLVGQYRIQAKSGNVIRIFHTAGVAGAQTITNPALVHMFSLIGTTVASIVATINGSNILTAAAVGSTSATVISSTKEETYLYASDATALAYGHNPTPAGTNRDRISLFDGINWVKKFQNANPNFTAKTAFLLPSSGVSSSIYAMHTAPNEDGVAGERFKLVPTTVKNVQHHFTQKAMSQLPILSEVDLSNGGKRVQIVSKQLGSAGGIQVLGGQSNRAETDIIGETQVAADSTGSYLLANVSAFPNAYAVGDMVKLQNVAGVRRQTRLSAADKISTFADGSGQIDYLWNTKTTNFSAATTITITDVSSSYADRSGSPLASGMIWRWTHSTAGAESLANVKAGDIVAAFNTPGWKHGNLARLPLEGAVTGFPIITVNDASRYFDIVNPVGRAMTATAIGVGSVSVFPAPRIRFRPAHEARTAITSMVRASNVMTVTCAKEHGLSTGDTFKIDGSSLVGSVTGAYTATSVNTFTFANVGADATEGAGATVMKSGNLPTHYRLEVLGVNNLVRLSYSSGVAPRFADAGVAVDDYIVISGNTFNSLNNGTYRVIAVDNNSVVFENPNAVENVNRVEPLNNLGLLTTWTANSNIVTGPAGAFKSLQYFDDAWLKKQEDPDSRYIKVNLVGDMNVATQVTLTEAYNGITGSAYGVAADHYFGADRGVELKDIDDITFLEGDAVLPNDKLFVQNITSADWFAANNAGNFPIIAVGSNSSDHRPFVRIKNSLGSTQTNRLMAVNTEGFYVVESNINKFYSYRLVSNSTISDSDSLRRSVYMLPDSRSYKFSEANGTSITHMGKLGFDLNASIGTDGYLFYTGLLRRVQRTVDGYSPDSTNFPERRAAGSRIETLPPLIKNLSLALTVTTNQGSTIQDVTNNVKSAIIDYVNNLGVGQAVILSSIIAKVMQVRGVAAVTFNIPAPSEERISVASNEKAVIAVENIGIN